MPIGALIKGRVADQWGPRWALGVAATAAALAVIAGLQAMKHEMDGHATEPR